MVFILDYFLVDDRYQQRLGRNRELCVELLLFLIHII